MRVFQYGVRQTAAVNTHTHTGIQTQENLTTNTRHTYRNIHTLYTLCINAWLFAYTPAHNPKMSGACICAHVGTIMPILEGI